MPRARALPVCSGSNAGSSNGRTLAFEAMNLGSTPSPATFGPLVQRLERHPVTVDVASSNLVRVAMKKKLTQKELQQAHDKDLMNQSWAQKGIEALKKGQLVKR